jgi:hypothetical protein
MLSQSRVHWTDLSENNRRSEIVRLSRGHWQALMKFALAHASAASSFSVQSEQYLVAAIHISARVAGLAFQLTK